MVRKHLGMLGLKVEDRVTGYKGVISSISFDLYGCVQGLIQPHVDKDGTINLGSWFDLNRLKILENEPVMNLPNFNYGPTAEGKTGAEIKPVKM